MTQVVQRMSFALDETHPIHGMHHQYPAGPGLGCFDMHYSLEIGIVLKGCIKRQYQDTEFELEEGGLWLAGIWEPHGFKVVKACDLLVLVVWPPLIARLNHPELAEISFLNMFRMKPALRPRRVPPDLEHCVPKFLRLLDMGSAFSAVRQRLLVTELLLGLQEQLPAGIPVSGGSAFSRISKAIDLALASENLVTNAAAARACAMSVSGFIRIFKQLMGISFAQFSLRQRLQKAAGALRDPERPVKGIARQYGFTDPSHFNHQFKKHYGLTPRQYRLSLAGRASCPSSDPEG